MQPSLKATPEGSAQISGHILDENGAPTSGAWVTVSCTCLATPLELATDETGLYVAHGLPTGPYEVRVRHRNEDLAKITFLPSGGKMRADFALRGPNAPIIILG